jgi:hypothetical protein
MKFKKATKYTFVFEECNEDGTEKDIFSCSIPTLYIRKSAISGPAQYITVQVEVNNG